MNQKNLKFFLSVCLMLTFMEVFANKIPPPPDRSGNTPPVGLPIDGGISLLFISGVAFGVFSLVKKKK